MSKHTVSVGFYVVHNVEIEADSPEAAYEKVQSTLKEQSLSDGLNTLEAKFVGICNDQDYLVQYEYEG